MNEPLTARPAREDRRITTCIECHERLVRETKDANGRYTFHHQSTGLNRCPDYAQPVRIHDQKTITVESPEPYGAGGF